CLREAAACHPRRLSSGPSREPRHNLRREAAAVAAAPPRPTLPPRPQPHPAPPPGGGAAPAAASSSTDSFSLLPPLPTTSEYIGNSLVSWCSVSLKRSASRFCSINWNCALVAPLGILATMSNRSLSSHFGPLI